MSDSEDALDLLAAALAPRILKLIRDDLIHELAPRPLQPAEHHARAVEKLRDLGYSVNGLPPTGEARQRPRGPTKKAK